MKHHVLRSNDQQMLFDLRQSEHSVPPQREADEESQARVISLSDALARHQEKIRQDRYDRISRLAEHLG